jgi:hypothetical protein
MSHCQMNENNCHARIRATVPRQRACWAALASVYIALGTHVVRAQIPGLQEWADSTSQAAAPKWKGPRVEFPPLESLQVGGRASRDGMQHDRARATNPAPLRVEISSQSPVAVSWRSDEEASWTSPAMRALEASQAVMRSMGWRPAFPRIVYDEAKQPRAAHMVDMLLVLDEQRSEPASASTDGPVLWSPLDSASTYAVVNPRLCPDLLACVLQAYAEAVLLAMDPAEHVHWRRATALYLTSEVTFHPIDREYEQSEHEAPHLGLAPNHERPSSGAFLRWVATRWQPGGVQFARELWDFARQRTWEGAGLRASPDVWMCLEQIAKHHQDDLTRVLEEYLASRSLNAPQATLAAKYAFDELPKHTPVWDPPLRPLGSRSMVVSTDPLHAPSTLKLWLDGEFGVRWSMTAIKLDAHGREIGRVTMPWQKKPKGYLAVELQPATHAVRVTVGNLGEGTPDADDSSNLARTAKLIVGK